MTKQSLVMILVLCFAQLATANAPTHGPYRYDLVRVIDGDTVVVSVDLWPGLHQQVSLRIDGVNTPEKRTRQQCEKAAGEAATKFTEAYMRQLNCMVVDVRLGKFAGRALGDIDCEGERLSNALITNGHARPYFGGKREPWCLDPNPAAFTPPVFFTPNLRQSLVSH